MIGKNTLRAPDFLRWDEEPPRVGLGEGLKFPAFPPGISFCCFMAHFLGYTRTVELIN
jgi:hypothetical protein